MNIKNIKIGARLGFAFSIVLTLGAVLALVGMVRLQQVADATVEMDTAIQKAFLANRWQANNRVNRALSEARLRAVDAADRESLAA